MRTCDITHHSWVVSKREFGDTDQLVSSMARELGGFIRSNYDFFLSWESIVVYYDNGQKEITNLVNSIFNPHLSVQVRKVVGLTASERDFFATPKNRAERALKKGYLKTLDRKRFGG